jgi:hypothetical protein
MKPKDWHKHFTTAFNPGRRHYMKVCKLTTKDKKWEHIEKLFTLNPRRPRLKNKDFSWRSKRAICMVTYVFFVATA